MSPPTILLAAIDTSSPPSVNSAWLTLVELTAAFGNSSTTTTRRYPGQVEALRGRLEKDLAANFDFAVLLAQDDAAFRVRLEMIALNFQRVGQGEPARALVVDGPLAYACPLELEPVCRRLESALIPCEVSYGAGIGLANAAYYTLFWTLQQQKLKTQPLLIHLPAATQQRIGDAPPGPSQPTALLAQAIRLVLEELGE